MHFCKQAKLLLLTVSAACAMAAHGAVPNLLWEKFVDGEPPPGFFGPVRQAAFDSNGNVFIAGTDYSQRESGCMFVTKLNGTGGAQQWWKTLCEATTSSVAYAITVDPFDNVIVTGLTASFSPEAGARTVKLSNDGAVIWDAKRVFGSSSLGGVDVASDRNGNVYVSARQSGPVHVILRYTRDGAFSWSQTEPMEWTDTTVHPDGDVFVAGTQLIEGARIWTVMRLRAGDGSSLWRAEEREKGGLAIAIALDSRANPVVTGSRGYPDKRIMKTAKYDGVIGSRIWLSELETDGDTRALSIAIDTRDDVVVSGSNGDYKTVKYRSSDGAPLWEASYAGRAGLDAVQSVSVDSAGDVTVTGYLNWENLAVSENTDMRTIKYSGSDGSAIWSAGYDSESGVSADIGLAVHDVADGVYAIGITSERGMRVAKYGKSVTPTASLQGLWWNSPAGSESGWGLNISHQGDKLFITWFTYDVLGRPTWYVMPNVHNVHGNRYEGLAYRMDGPVFSSLPFNSLQVVPISEDRVSLTFTDSTNGRFGFFGSSTLSKAITRLDFFAPVPDCRLGGSVAGNANYQDLWWASPPGFESGWGLNLAHQGDVIFATWFTYNAEGKATWFVASDVRRQADGSFFGTLEQTSGPAYNANPWDPSRVQRNPVGNMRLTFSDYERGIFAYTVNAVSQSKPITRLLFSTDPTRCH